MSWVDRNCVDLYEGCWVTLFRIVVCFICVFMRELLFQVQMLACSCVSQGSFAIACVRVESWDCSALFGRVDHLCCLILIFACGSLVRSLVLYLQFASRAKPPDLGPCRAHVF